MKIHIYHAPQAGNVFLIAMVVTSMLCLISLGSYLSLSSAQNNSVMRSLAWNAALPLAEAGVEEALSHVSKNTASYAVDNWTLNGTNYTHPSRTLASGNYSVNIGGSPGSMLTINSTGSALVRDTNYVSRTVQVTVQTGSTIPRQLGMIAKNTITFKGNFAVDSYDSTNALSSTNGKYDPAKAGAQATIETPLGFDLGGNASVAGYVASGPSGSITSKGSSSVGDAAWVNAGSKGIEAGHQTNNFTAAIPDVVLPYTSAAAPASGTVSNTSYSYVLDGGNYMVTNLTAGGGNTTVVVTAPSTLVVSGTVSLAKVVFAPGATLDLYVDTPTIDFLPTLTPLTGTQAVTPIQFRVWGLPSVTDMHLNNGQSFTAMIYAPELNFQANGHASFYGSITGSTFDINGTFDFHYDQATASYTPAVTSFQIVSWAEK